MEDILIINSAPFTNEFVEPIAELYEKENIKHTVVNFDQIPEDIQKFSGVIISSSPKGDDIIEKQLPYYNWIKSYSKPIIGSCHGHQLLGTIYGSKVIVGKEAEEGIRPIELIRDDKLFDGISRIMQVEQHHEKSITKPINFALLARSSTCNNQIIKHRSRPFYGCQFHIEKSPELLMNFVNICRQVITRKVMV